jgi:hypothetical protein
VSRGTFFELGGCGKVWRSRGIATSRSAVVVHTGWIYFEAGEYFKDEVYLRFDVYVMQRGLTAHTLMAFGGLQTSNIAVNLFRTPYLDFDHPRTRQAGIYGKHIA